VVQDPGFDVKKVKCYSSYLSLNDSQARMRIDNHSDDAVRARFGINDCDFNETIGWLMAIEKLDLALL